MSRRNVFSEKVTCLDVLDMHFVKFSDLGKQLLQIRLQMSQIDEIDVYINNTYMIVGFYC